MTVLVHVFSAKNLEEVQLVEEQKGFTKLSELPKVLKRLSEIQVWQTKHCQVLSYFPTV